MKERPILFKGPMVRAILEGRKTQTRRLVMSGAKNMQRQGCECIAYRPLGDKWYGDHVWSMRGTSGVWHDYKHGRFMSLCPQGKPGDVLWVRENWAVGTIYDGVKPSDIHPGAKVLYPADAEPKGVKIRPSIHIPRWASRINLEIINVKVERLQDMTENDALCEGAELTCAHCGEPFCIEKCAMGACWKPDCGEEDFSFIAGFKTLWDSLAKPGFRWTDNPYVWVIEFRKVTE